MESPYIKRGRGRSRLSPHRQRILTLRAQFISYPEIAAILAGEGMIVSANTLEAYRRRHIALEEIERRRSQLSRPRPRS